MKLRDTKEFMNKTTFLSFPDLPVLPKAFGIGDRGVQKDAGSPIKPVPTGSKRGNFGHDIERCRM